MSRIEITRHASADPASVALLLAEPAAAVDVGLLRTGADLTGSVGPVRRSGVGFAAGVDIAGRDGATARGQLTVVPAMDDGCDVSVSLKPAADDGAAAFRLWAAGFLESLVERARLRAGAA